MLGHNTSLDFHCCFYNSSIIVPKPGFGMNHKKTIKALKMCNSPGFNLVYSDKEN